MPEEDVLVEQDLHRPSNPRTISSGSGASKSSGTRNIPAQRPRGLGDTGTIAAGRSSATGRPSRTTRSDSPPWTRSSTASGCCWSSRRVMVLILVVYHRGTDRGRRTQFIHQSRRLVNGAGGIHNDLGIDINHIVRVLRGYSHRPAICKRRTRYAPRAALMGRSVGMRKYSMRLPSQPRSRSLR